VYWKILHKPVYKGMIVTNRWGQRLLNGQVLEAKVEDDKVILGVLTHAKNVPYRVELDQDDMDEIRKGLKFDLVGESQ